MTCFFHGDLGPFQGISVRDLQGQGDKAWSRNESPGNNSLKPKQNTLPETNIASENRTSQKETIVFQPSIFRCELLVSGRVHPVDNNHELITLHPNNFESTLNGKSFITSFLQHENFPCIHSFIHLEDPIT